MEITIQLTDEQYVKFQQKAKSMGFDTVKKYLKKLVDKEIENIIAEEDKIAEKLKVLGYM